MMLSPLLPPPPNHKTAMDVVRAGFHGPPLRITSPFGPRVHPILHTWKQHDGVDLAVRQGTPVFPVAAGRVVYNGENKAGGRSVTIEHSPGLQTSYSHLSAHFVDVGDRADPRRPIGLSGGAKGTPGAGRSTGPHLHLQVRQNGRTVDPVPRIDWYGWRLVYGRH